MTGDASVLFACEEYTQNTLQKHNYLLGKRYMELFRSKTTEVQQDLNGFSSAPLIPLPSPPIIPLTSAMCAPHKRKRLYTSVRSSLCWHSRGHSGLPEGVFHRYSDAWGSHGIEYPGCPSGDTFTQMKSTDRAFMAAQKYHLKKITMKEKYVAVFQCSIEEINFVLMGGTLNWNGLLPVPWKSHACLLQHIPSSCSHDSYRSCRLSAISALQSPGSAAPHRILPSRLSALLFSPGELQPSTAYCPAASQFFMNYTASYPR